MRQNLKYILLLAGGFGILILMEWFRPVPLNWSPSYTKNDRIPYGGQVLFQLLPEIFPEQNLAVTNMPIYNAAQDGMIKNGNYIFINEDFAPDELDTRELLAFVANGNMAFIAAQRFSGKLADTLKLKTDFYFAAAWADSLSLNFVSPHLQRAQNYLYSQRQDAARFSGFDTLRTTALGIDGDGKINFIKITFGAGAFYLNAVPVAFTNYNLLYRDNAAYVFAALSYLPLQTVYWDEYYKAGRQAIRTPLRYVLSHEALRWAYYVTLTSVILFIVVAGRRRQRIIPVKLPKTNTTLEFVKTVGRLYFQHRDHKNIAEKKITHFFDYVRAHFYLPTPHLHAELAKKLAGKSGVAVDKIMQLFAQIENIRTKPQIDEAELIALNASIEFFHKK